MFFVNEEIPRKSLWIVSFKCVVKGYQKCRFDVKDGEVFKVLKKIGETGRAFKCRGQFINGVSVIRLNCKKRTRKTCFDGLALGLLWACFV